MAKSSRRSTPTHTPAVRDRADDLRDHHETQYWLVASRTDLLALLGGVVSTNLRKEAKALLQPFLGV